MRVRRRAEVPVLHSSTVYASGSLFHLTLALRIGATKWVMTLKRGTIWIVASRLCTMANHPGGPCAYPCWIGCVRWIDDSLVIFALARRVQDMAKTEAAMLLAAVCARFDFALAPGQVRDLKELRTRGDPLFSPVGDCSIMGTCRGQSSEECFLECFGSADTSRSVGGFQAPLRPATGASDQLPIAPVGEDSDTRGSIYTSSVRRLVSMPRGASRGDPSRPHPGEAWISVL